MIWEHLGSHESTAIIRSKQKSLLKWSHDTFFFTFKSSKLGGRGPGFLLEILLFCLGVLAAAEDVLLLKVFSGTFPVLLCLSLTGL